IPPGQCLPATADGRHGRRPPRADLAEPGLRLSPRPGKRRTKERLLDRPVERDRERLAALPREGPPPLGAGRPKGAFVSVEGTRVSLRLGQAELLRPSADRAVRGGGRVLFLPGRLARGRAHRHLPEQRPGWRISDVWPGSRRTRPG